MVTEARMRAQLKYNRLHTRQITLRLNLRTEDDIIRHLDMQPNKQGYLKSLIRADMAREEEEAACERSLEELRRIALAHYGKEDGHGA